MDFSRRLSNHMIEELSKLSAHRNGFFRSSLSEKGTLRLTPTLYTSLHKMTSSSSDVGSDKLSTDGAAFGFAHC